MFKFSPVFRLRPIFLRPLMMVLPLLGMLEKYPNEQATGAAL